MGRPCWMRFSENEIRTLLRHMTPRMHIYKIVKEELSARGLWRKNRPRGRNVKHGKAG